MIPSDTETCGSCLFFQGVYAASKSEPIGFCRRFPPVESDPLKVGIAAFAHPMVTAAQWCGEYEALEPEPELSWLPTPGRQQ
jgi:hypothetical protein